MKNIDCFTKAEYDTIYPTESKPRTLYGSDKVPAIDYCPPFRSIFWRLAHLHII